MTKNAGKNDLSQATGSLRRSRLHQIGRWVREGRPWRSLAALSLIGVATTALALPSGGVQTVDVAHTVSLTSVWGPVSLNDAGNPIALSSPNVANLPGGPAVVVGDRAGHVYAMSLATGANVWTAGTGGVPVDSTPSVAVTPRAVSTRSSSASATPRATHSGGYEAFTPTGGTQWFTNTQNPSTDQSPGNAVQASLTVGDLEGGTDVVAGSLGEVTQALNATSGGILPGYPWFQGDSNFTTPVVADIYGNGQNDVIEGGDSTAGTAYGTTYQNGGHLRVVLPTGNAFQGNPAGGLVCQYNTDETVESSPAVGEFLGGGGVGIAFGTGNTYKKTTTDDVIAVNAHCGAAWTAKLNGVTTSSPALANLSGNGQLDVVEGTQAGSNGTVYALNGTNGAVLWQTTVGNPVIGSVVTADLSGGGYQDVIVPTTNGVQILDGKTGAIVDTIGQNMGFQNSPLVTDDANGTIGITIAGYGRPEPGGR
jgi:outer membrane protein assembly factor BamB